MPSEKISRKQVKMQPADCEDSVARLSTNRADKIRERLDSLFADIKRLTSDPASDTPEIRLELEALRARLLELEKQVLESKETPAQPDTVMQAPPAVDVASTSCCGYTGASCRPDPV